LANLKIADSVTNRLEELLKEIQKEQNPTISIPRTMRNFKVLVTGGPGSAQ
jgi:DNA helicase IV